MQKLNHKGSLRKYSQCYTIFVVPDSPNIWIKNITTEINNKTLIAIIDMGETIIKLDNDTQNTPVYNFVIKNSKFIRK